MTAVVWLAIRYRDFYDVPRLLAAKLGDWIYVLDCPFDDALDNYPDYFSVYRLAAELESHLDDASWEQLTQLGELVGQVAVDAVEFDRSQRRAITTSFLNRVEP